MMKNFAVALTILFLSAFLVPGGSSVAFAQENGTFSGRILDVAQQPVAGAAVFVYTSANIRRAADYISPATAGDGVFQVTLPAGHYWVVARARKGEQQYGPLLTGDRHSGAPMEIDVKAGQAGQEDFVVADLKETSRLAVKLDTSFLQIEGTLRSKDGKPLANGYAFARRDKAGKGIPEYVSAWSDENGKYTLFLPPGTYWLGLAYQFPPPAEIVPAQKMTIDKPAKNINIVYQE